MTIDGQTVFSAFTTIFMLALGVIAFFLRRELARMERQLEQLASRAHDLELDATRTRAEAQQVVTNETLQRELGRLGDRFATKEDHSAMLARIDTLGTRLSTIAEALARIETSVSLRGPMVPKRGKA